jgi:hypothetical protein
MRREKQNRIKRPSARGEDPGSGAQGRSIDLKLHQGLALPHLRERSHRVPGDFGRQSLTFRTAVRELLSKTAARSLRRARPCERDGRDRMIVLAADADDQVGTPDEVRGLSVAYLPRSPRTSSRSWRSRGHVVRRGSRPWTPCRKRGQPKPIQPASAYSLGIVRHPCFTASCRDDDRRPFSLIDRCRCGGRLLHNVKE